MMVSIENVLIIIATIPVAVGIYMFFTVDFDVAVDAALDLIKPLLAKVAAKAKVVLISLISQIDP